MERVANRFWIFASIQMMAVNEAAKSRIITFDIDQSRKMQAVEYAQWKEKLDTVFESDFGVGLFKLVAQSSG